MRKIHNVKMLILYTTNVLFLAKIPEKNTWNEYMLKYLRIA